jgi:hypothetical protein
MNSVHAECFETFPVIPSILGIRNDMLTTQPLPPAEEKHSSDVSLVRAWVVRDARATRA